MFQSMWYTVCRPDGMAGACSGVPCKAYTRDPKVIQSKVSPFLWKSVPYARFALIGAHQWYVDVIGTIPRDSVDCDMGGT